jgi:diacylglycerol kinase (ATP)
MRAAAILGPGKVLRHVQEFQRIPGAYWTASTSTDQADAVVIFGGDGTVHRHLSALVDLRLPVLVVPCGSGNDFARALKLPTVRDSLESWCKFIAGGNNVRTIDLGVIKSKAAAEAPFDSAQGRSAPHNPAYHFCCVAGVGIDTEIARRANQLPRWVRSHGGYALCAPGQFFRFDPFLMKISCKDANVSTFRPTILAAFANAPAYGGGMKIAPQAKLDDGKLDICIVRAMDRFKLFCLFPTVYFGKHLSFNEVEYDQATVVTVETKLPLDVYADGEYVCQTPVEFSIVRNALRVIVPE